MGISVSPEVDQINSGILSPSSVFYFLLLPALALWYTYWYMSRRHLIKLATKIPGPVGYPIIGSAYLLQGSANGN